MKTYRVGSSPLLFDGVRYVEGETVPVTAIPPQWLSYHLDAGHLIETDEAEEVQDHDA